VEQRYAADPWESLIDEWLRAPEREGLVALVGVTTNDVLGGVGLRPESRDRAAQMRVGGILRRLGLERRKERRDVGFAWVYRRPVPTVPSSEQGRNGGSTSTKSS
jgi:hypothetical protein